MTLLRTIIGVDIAHLVHDSGEGSQQVSVGVGVVSQESFAAGSLPDPEVVADFPIRGWIFRARYRIFGFAADQPQFMTRRIDMDIRAKRKLDNGESYWRSVNTNEEGVIGVILVSGMVR